MITVHGFLGAISDELRADVSDADLVVGGTRHLDALAVPEPNRQVLGRVAPAVERIRALPDEAKVVVVASGDPLLWGVVRRLREEGLRMRVIPAVSSLQAAFAAVALPWEDALLVSSHAGDLDEVIAACRRHPKVGALTAPSRGVEEIAEGLEGIERWYVVAERLGEEDERVRVLDRDEVLALDDVRQPHVVLVLAQHPDDPAVPVAEAADAEREGAPVLAQITNSAAARRHADAIDKALRIKSVRYDGPATRAFPEAWRTSDLIVSHLALGATTRIVAPLLEDKRRDPGVVVVDEAGRFAVPLVGGHAGGANELATRVGEALGATPVLTTATDSLGIPALDQLGWAYSGDVAGVTRAILDGRPVDVHRDQPWPLPPLPENVAEETAQAEARIVVTDAREADASGLPTVVLHPDSLVVGMGCNSGTGVDELRSLLHSTLEHAGLALESVSALVSHDVKAGELGMIRLAGELGVPFVTYSSEELSGHDVPTPSEQVTRAVGVPSVSEAAVLAHGARLEVPKRKTSEATCAVGRIPARGKLTVVGLGPGSRDLLTPRAVRAIREATFVAGYAPYVRQIRDLIRPGAKVLATKMGTEQERTAAAIETAREGRRVAFVCGGDPAIYAMASPTLEMGTDGIDVEIVPGVTAELASSALLGAPLGHDHVTVSLSDLHTDWDQIVRRVRAAAEGDFVVALYNPRSRKRLHHLPDALAILAEHRPRTTPIALVAHAERKQQEIRMSTLEEFDPEWVDMNTTVIVGSSTTKYVTSGDGRKLVVTPRDYHWMEKDND